MQSQVPRLLLAGVSSGCGKTTVTCAVLSAFVRRGLRTGACKCGPDYIDPMFYKVITGMRGINLDPFFFDRDTMNELLFRRGAGCDVCVIEGVMGYYDGLSPSETKASTYEVAVATGTPAVLIVDAKGASRSILATLHGFLTFSPDSRIHGVILNRCSPMLYPALHRAILDSFQGRIQPLGYLPPMEDCVLESRRLGLVTAMEAEGLREKLQKLAEQAERTLDINGLLRLAGEAGSVCCQPAGLPVYAPVRIGVARDRAFCFYYEDSLQMLRDMGAELIEFSPLSDSELPEAIQGLILGGGYPEIYAEELSENASMRESIRAALQKGIPCIAECGGFMYLTERIAGFPMAGVLPGECRDTGRLTRFGYVTLTARRDNLLCRKGEKIRGHEFHYWDASVPGDGFTAVKPSGKRWTCAVATERLYAGYPHFHFYANPSFAKAFYETCLKERPVYA